MDAAYRQPAKTGGALATVKKWWDSLTEVTPEVEQRRAVAVAQRSQQRAIAEAERQQRRQRENTQRRVEAEFKARCESEARLRGYAIEAATNEAKKIVDRMGASKLWVSENVYWYDSEKTKQYAPMTEQREMIRLQLIQKYTEQIMKSQPDASLVQQVQQMNAYGNASFANSFQVQHLAPAPQNTIGSKTVLFED